MYSYQEVSYGQFNVWLLTLSMLIGHNLSNTYYTFDYEIMGDKYSLWINPFKEETENVLLCINQHNCHEITIPAITVMRLVDKYEKTTH